MPAEKEIFAWNSSFFNVSDRGQIRGIWFYHPFKNPFDEFYDGKKAVGLSVGVPVRKERKKNSFFTP